MWTIIGPDRQCLVRSKDSKDINEALNELETIPLSKTVPAKRWADIFSV